MSSSEETESCSEDSRLSDTSSESSEDDQNDSFEDGECDEIETQSKLPFPCLLCTDIVPDVEGALNHLKDRHRLDLVMLRRKHEMDQMSYVKLVNFLRKKCTGEKKNAEDLVSSVNGCSKPVWDQDEYLQPTWEEDPMLMHWFESEENELEENLSSAMQDVAINGDTGNDEKISVSATDYRHLEQKASSLSDTVQVLMEQIKTMQGVMSRVLNEDKTDVVVASGSKRKRNSVDEVYFESYDDFGIHDQMISDLARTEAYELAILNNKDDFTGKVVLDVGCGTGILSMFAAKAGAAKVVGVDRSRILKTALKIIKDNGFEDKIECVSGKIEEISLPVDKVDIIISEYMGYFLLYEGMLESYLVARDRFLKPGGLMLPSTAELYMFGCDDNGDLAHHYNKWDNMHGFKMSLLKPKLDIAMVETIPTAHVVTESVQVMNLDMTTCKYSDAAFTSPFTLVPQKDCSITAIGGYFDTGFNMGSAYKHTLTTSPFAPSTHWFQTLFPLKEVIPAKQGDKIEGSIHVRPNLKNPRALDIDISIGNNSYSYKLK